LLAAVYTHGLCHPQGALSDRLAAVTLAGMRKRSITINGHRTSISLEDAFWEELSALARAGNLSINALVSRIDQAKSSSENLSSALRLHVLKTLQEKISRV
jgi:predicted DNA-binding ribbon-helix-helix protein